MLASIPDTIVFDVKNTWVARVRLVTVGKAAPVENSRVERGEDRVRWILRCVLDACRTEAPLFFVGHRVPMEEWERIYDVINDDLVPVIAESRHIDDVLRKEMVLCTHKQISKSTG